ncbi:MAG: hypothetical protein LBJ59_09640, partial [Zoogloeaceae bacterium]|nr:hypothetical protein [Zoogloeaceae bacterium]
FLFLFALGASMWAQAQTVMPRVELSIGLFRVLAEVAATPELLYANICATLYIRRTRSAGNTAVKHAPAPSVLSIFSLAS